MKLLIADDHTLFRDALVQYIERSQASASVTVTKDFHDAYDVLVSDQDYDLVILDLRMPGMHGMDGFKKVRDEFPDTKLALMSGVAETQDVELAMSLGASGYFPKTMSGKALIQAIEDVLAGTIFIPMNQISQKIMPAYYEDEKRVNFKYNGMSETQSGYNADGSNIDFGLTPRETEVLGYLAQGQSNKEIASELGLQVVTVKLHVRGICRKLEANNRTQAALKATELGLVNVSMRDNSAISSP